MENDQAVALRGRVFTAPEADARTLHGVALKLEMKRRPGSYGQEGFVYVFSDYDGDWRNPESDHGFTWVVLMPVRFKEGDAADFTFIAERVPGGREGDADVAKASEPEWYEVRFVHGDYAGEIRGYWTLIDGPHGA